MLTSTITNRAGRVLTLIHGTGHAHVIPQKHGNRRFYAVKVDGQEYTDLHATSQQAAMLRAFITSPAARSVVVRSPR